MCISTLPCFASPLVALLLGLFVIAIVFYTGRISKYFLLVVPILILSVDVYARAGGGSSGGKCGLLCIILAPFFMAYAAYVSHKINKKNTAVRAALAEMAVREPQWTESHLLDSATKMFIDLQAAWSNQDLPTIKAHLHPSLYLNWEMQIKSQQYRHERNVMENLSVNNVRIVNVKNHRDDEKDEFTICFDASAIDKTFRNGEVKEQGKNEAFREFWTFEWENGKWTLREVTQSGGWRRFVYAPIVDEMNRGFIIRKRA